MQFEQFANTGECGKKTIDEMKSIVTSESSRNDARRGHGEVRTFLQEFDYLVQQKMEAESQLSGYSQAVFGKEQARIRREFGSRSFDEWIKRKAELDAERRKILDRKARIENRMRAIKSKARNEQAEISARRHSAIRAEGNTKLEGMMERLAKAIEMLIVTIQNQR